MIIVGFIELEPRAIPVLGQLHVLSSVHTRAALLMFNIQVGFCASAQFKRQMVMNMLSAMFQRRSGWQCHPHRSFISA